MSIWSQYDALANYITFKYQFELQIVLDTVASVVQEQHEPGNLRSTDTRHIRREVAKITSRALTVTRAAPSVDT